MRHQRRRSRRPLAPRPRAKLLSRHEVEKKVKPFLDLILVAMLAYATHIAFFGIHSVVDWIVPHSEFIDWMFVIHELGVIVVLLIIMTKDLRECLDKHVVS